MFTLDRVVPWGRSFDEYRRMFALSDDDLRGHIAGIGDGPASFNAEAAARGTPAVSCDPLYAFDGASIAHRIDETFDTVVEQTRTNALEFVWTGITSVEQLAAVRRRAMDRFLADLAAGGSDGRYVAGALPALPFADTAFDLALCSHLLFLYSDHLDAAFHVASAVELCRIAREVRIFPLLALGGRRSPHVGVVTTSLVARGYRIAIENVDYEFQRGGNQMLRITRRSG
jgi:hypothetical protein